MLSHSRTRLRPGLFFASLLALLSLAGCPTPLPAAPLAQAGHKISTSSAPNAEHLTRLYYSWAGGPRQPGGLIGSGLTAAELRACGLDAILTAGDWDLRYRWLTETLTEDAVRACLAPIVAAADGMPLWLELGVSNQGPPLRTFYDPRDSALRARSLANLQLIAQLAAEYGIQHIGFDWEAYGVGSWVFTYPPAKARIIGAELAAVARRGNPSVQLFGFCPLSFYSQVPGFRALARGWYGKGGVFLDEDVYGMPSNTVPQLRWAHQFTHAQAGAGWFASERAEAGAAWFYQCAPQLQRAAAYCPVVLVYRIGAPLWRDRPDLRDAAGSVLRSLTPLTERFHTLEVRPADRAN